MSVRILKNHSLKEANTFGVDVAAELFAAVQSEEELIELIVAADQKPWLLGGGSNLLLTGDVAGLVIQNDIKGIEVLEEDADTVVLRVGGGVIWHDLVLWAVSQGYGGIENLALIPGRVGAAPIQNIGAYGIELKDVFDRLEAVNLDDGSVHDFLYDDCHFGYRDSVFKNELRGKFCITRVIIRLVKGDYRPDITYGAIREFLSIKNITTPTMLDVCDTVIAIRSSKLPDPKEIGNSGSFFKNPIVSEAKFEEIAATEARVPSYPAGEGYVKIPAGWLIEQCGWKGKSMGNVGCYERQALVIVNHGNATGSEILDFALRVQQSVSDRFGIKLSPEVNII